MRRSRPVADRDPFARATPLSAEESAELAAFDKRWFRDKGAGDHLSPTEACWALTLALRALANR
jgi:hypothetical protein